MNLNHRLTTLLSAVLFCLLITACEQNKLPSVQSPQGIPPVNKAALRAHVEFLADDLLEGRATGTPGYNIAAKYVASHFAQYQLKPAGDANSFLQKINFRERLVTPASAKLKVSHSDGELTFKFPDEFITRGSSFATEQNITAPLVFAGYGIDAPELNHQDYESLEVKGKIVVVLSGQPRSFPSEEGAHFASSRQRALAAAKHGAVGIIMLQTPQAEHRYSYERLKRTANEPSLNWLGDNGEPGNGIPEIKGAALLSQDAAKKLLHHAEVDFPTLIELTEKQAPLPKFDLDAKASISSQTHFKKIESYNVAGIVEGTDPDLKNEFVVYTAHLDHLGTTNHLGIIDHQGTNAHLKTSDHSEDVVYNGALDNASGTSIMIETARLFANHPPRRSVLFIAMTAEEKGLLGSDYYSQNPTVPIKNMVANINLDMPLILYPIGDVIAFGAQHSTMETYVQRAAEKLDLQLSPDPMPEQNIFVRSDHYSFVKQGVPAVFLVPGFKSLDESINGEALFQQFFANHYHQPSDQSDLPINYNAGARFVQVNYLIGWEIGNSDSRPQWNEGNFFGKTFGRKR